MKELFLTHNIGGIANIALCDNKTKEVIVKRVPSASLAFRRLMQSGKLKERLPVLRDDGDVWLFMRQYKDWVVVSCNGSVRTSCDYSRLERDEAAFLSAFVELPAAVDKSKVFVAKLFSTGQRVPLRKYISDGFYFPDIARAFYHMLGSVPDAPESVEDVSRLELCGHTLNVLYGSNLALLDPSVLCELNWLRPQIFGDVLLWRGMTAAQDKTLYVYLKGDYVLYVGYQTMPEVAFNRYVTNLKVVRDVLTYDSLLTQSCEGLLDVNVDANMRKDKCNRVKVCGEPLPVEWGDNITDFVYDSMVLFDSYYVAGETAYGVHRHWLYDVVNCKIYVFKAYDSDFLGTYYGAISVEEWRKRRKGVLNEN